MGKGQAARAYYNANTRGFMRWGQGGASGAIHRAVWAPGVNTRDQAFAWAHRRALQEAPTGAAVLDLGCGVGSAIVAHALGDGDARIPGPRRGVGVSISETQIELARARAELEGVAAHARFIHADFCELPSPGANVVGSRVLDAFAPFGLAFSIEAFAHADTPANFFTSVVPHLRVGARLVIIDDVRSTKPAGTRERGWLEAFAVGWKIPALSTLAQMVGLAEAAGFSLRVNEKLNAFLELGRPRDRAIRTLLRSEKLPLVGGLLHGLMSVGDKGLGLGGEAWWANLRGGDALQRCLIAGLIDYRCLVFELVEGGQA